MALMIVIVTFAIFVIATVLVVHRIAVKRGLSFDDNVFIASRRCTWPVVGCTALVTGVLLWEYFAPWQIMQAVINVLIGIFLVTALIGGSLVLDFVLQDRALQSARTKAIRGAGQD